jgi:multiple sugar transport system substrate-binding protein
MKPRILPLLCVLLLLAGCAPETSPAATATAAPATATPAPTSRTPTATAAGTSEPVETIDLVPEDIAGVTVELWHVWDGDRESLLETLVSEFNAGNEYGVEVTAVRQTDLHGAVARALAEGDPPDLAFGFSYHVRSWSRIEPPVDWTPYLLDPEWGWEPAEVDDFYPEFFAAANVDGRQTGLPLYRTAEILIYNRTWAGELGFLAPPVTPDELAEQACAANASRRDDADPGNDGEGGVMLGYEPGALAAWLAAFGGGPAPLQDGEAYAFDRPENIAAFEHLRGMLDGLCAWLPEGVYPHDEFAARRGLFLPSTLAGLAAQAEAMEAAGSADAWSVIPYPAAAPGASGFFYGPDLVLLPTGSPRQLAAWVFAGWLLAPENMARWSEAGGYFPARTSALGLMIDPPLALEAWIPAAAMFTPPASWVDVQWAVGEMTRMLFSPFTPASDIHVLAGELDAFAEELHQPYR